MNAGRDSTILLLLAVAALALARQSGTPASQITPSQQRLLEIGMALSTRPSLLLLDEVAAGLTENELEATARLIRSLRDELGLCILWIEHAVGTLLRHVERVIVLHHGRKLADGPPSEVIANAEVVEGPTWATRWPARRWLARRCPVRAHQLAGTMSGGEQQMVAVARAMMSAPRLLMLDEPSLGLAPRMVDELLTIARRIADAGTTVLMVEQNVRKALAVADRGYVLERGRLVAAGSATELMGSDAIRRAYLGADSGNTA